MSSPTWNRCRRRFSQLAVTGLVVWLVATHWPLAALVYARFNHTRPRPAAVRYWLAHFSDSPVNRALARGRIHEGQPVDEVIERYGPFRIITTGRYTRLLEPGELLPVFEGYTLFARDGRMVYAGWHTCTMDVEFFDGLSPADHKEVVAAMNEWRQTRLNARMAEVGPLADHLPSVIASDRSESERAADMAVGGPLGYIALYESPPPPEP